MPSSGTLTPALASSARIRSLSASFSVWGSSSEWQSPDTVGEHVRRLRRKLGDDTAEHPYLVNRRGYGYKFDPGTHA